MRQRHISETGSEQALRTKGIVLVDQRVQWSCYLARGAPNFTFSHAFGTRSPSVKRRLHRVHNTPFYLHWVHYAPLRKFLPGVSRAVWYGIEPSAVKGRYRVQKAPAVVLLTAEEGVKFGTRLGV